MKKSLLGFIIGTSTLALAIPIVTFAASSSAGSQSSSTASRFTPSQACAAALAAKDQLKLTNMDGINQARKAALQTRKDALTAAAAITDDTLRKDAVKKANDDFRTSMKTLMDQTKVTRQTTTDAIRTACGKGGRIMGGDGFGKDGIDGPGKHRGEENGKKKGWLKHGPQNENESSSTSSAR